MKKSLLALGVLATPLSAQTSVTIYGIVDAGVTHTTNDGPVGDRTTVEGWELEVAAVFRRAITAVHLRPLARQEREL